MPASIRRASDGAIGRMPNSSPAPMIAFHRSVPRRAVEEVDLEARHGRPSGAADQHGDAVDLELLAPVVADVVDGGADELLEGLPRQRPLHLHRVHVGQRDLGVQTAGGEYPQGVQPRVGVRQLHPPDVLSTCRSTGSFTMPPSGAVTSMYLPCFTAHFVRSRQVIRSISRSASGPLTCTVRSTPTSHRVTASFSALYSTSGSS